MNTTSTVVCDSCGAKWQAVSAGPCAKCLTGEGHMQHKPIVSFNVSQVGRSLDEVSCYSGPRTAANRDGSGYRCMPMRAEW